MLSQRQRRGSLLVLTLAALFFALLVLRQPRDRTPGPDPADPIYNAPGASLEQIVNPQPDLPIDVASEEPLLDAIENESVLTFASPADYDAFLDATQDRNLQLLSQNRRLLSLRLALSPEEAARLRQGIGKDAQWDSNYTLLAPLPVDPEIDYGHQEFADQALRFIGAPPNPNAGQGITIAVIDSGIQNHTTLSGVAIERIDLVNDPIDLSEIDQASHGTAVASLIAGQDGNGIAPAASLLSIRVLDADGIGDTFSLANGIVEAVDRGAAIINMSLGSFGSNAALENAVAYAQAHGVPLVASAGNEGVNALPFPAAYPSVIAVSAIDALGQPTAFANQGPQVDIAAPGVGLYSAWGTDQWIRFTGTSASTPIVSGAIAAISSELDLPPAEAAALILQNANDIAKPGSDSLSGAGYLDLQRTLNANTPGIRDLALADIFLDPQVDEFGRHTVYVTAQNRGTEPLATAEIELTGPNGLTQSIYLGPLAPGQSAGHTMALDPRQLAAEKGFPLTAQAKTNQDDQRRDNDTREKRLSLAPPAP